MSSDSVQRGASILVGGAVIAIVSYLTYAQFTAPRSAYPRGEGDASTAPAQSASAAPAASSVAARVNSPTDEFDAGPLTLSGLALVVDAGGGMPQGAPRTVRIGVVLVQFTGAEGASSTARSKPEALLHAQKLVVDAKADFKHTVPSGDSGSSEDIGKIPRGVLDPRTEIAVFSLPAGEVSDVLETPRGYWIVKRIE